MIRSAHIRYSAKPTVTETADPATQSLEPWPGLDEAGVAIPPARAGTVRRTTLLRRMRAAGSHRVVVIAAPAGFGKTTVLAQWASSDPRPVAWVTVNEGHNDAIALFRDIAIAINRCERLDPAVFDAIASPDLSGYLLASRLRSAVRGDAVPVLLILDDAHRLTDRSCIDALAELVGRLPQSWQVAIAGRDEIAVPLGRLRADAVLVELGAADLAMDEREATTLVRRLRLALSVDEVRELVRRSNGWPAIIYLAALAASRSRDPGAVVPGRADFVADYLRSEVLDRCSDAQVALLLDTAVLERVNGSLGDAVVGQAGSAGLLASLARSTLLVGEAGDWYRYHSLLREFLRTELERRSPGRLAEIHRRAALWYELHGFIDLAVDHAFAAGDLDHAAAIVAGAALRYHWSGRRATVRAWLARFGDAELDKRPWLAVIGAIEEAGIGEVTSSEHLADIVERGSFEGRPPDGTASFEAGRALLRAVLCRTGAADMLSNATLATALEGAGSPWRDLALWTLAYGRLLGGDLASADDALADTVATARANRNHGTCQNALAQRALLAIGDGDWASAVVFAEGAGTIVVDAHLDGYQVTALTCAVLARIAIHRGDIKRANLELSRAASLRPQLTAAIPWLNVTALIAIAQAYLAAGDPAGARTLVVQAEDVVRLRPDLGVLPSQVAALRERVAALPIGLAGASTLTAAELRVLAFLPLYLSFKEIGDRLGVRASTVHTHATAIYGKLGASSRSQAIELAIEAGLLDGRPDWYATSPIAVDAPGPVR